MIKLWQNNNKLPIVFIGTLLIFVISLYAFNFEAIQEKFGVETRTSALRKLENANNTIEQLKVANNRLLKEIEKQNKIHSITDSTIKQLNTDTAAVTETVSEIEKNKQIALNQLDSSDCDSDNAVDDASVLCANEDMPDISIPKTVDSVDNAFNKPTPIIKAKLTKPAKSSTSISKSKNDSIPKSKTDKRSKILITALWDTYNLLHAG